MREIILSRKKIALVDDEDYEYLMQWVWYAQKCRHVYYAKNGSMGVMHRLIMNCPKGMVVDHVDHNGLNNQKSNLRICTNSENVRNRIKRKGTSKYIGVYLRNNKYIAGISINQKHINLGTYTCEKHAAIAYNEAVLKYGGEHDAINVI